MNEAFPDIFNSSGLPSPKRFDILMVALNQFRLRQDSKACNTDCYLVSSKRRTAHHPIIKAPNEKAATSSSIED